MPKSKTSRAKRTKGKAHAPSTAKRPTINDVARLAGVSKKTVSRVINDSQSVKGATRDKVKAVISQSGFVPDVQARGLAFRRSFLVAMIYDNPSPQYVVNMQQGILDALGHTSCQLVVRPCDRSSPTFLEDMRAFVERQRLFGAILPPSVSEDDGLAEILRDLNCPYIRIASVPLDDPKVMLVTNDHVGGREAARHFADLGHTVIAHVSGPLTFRSAHERRRGFVEALAERKIELLPQYTLEGAYTFESGLACGERMLGMNPRPTAVFVGNDDMAAGIYRAARNLGMEIPRDLSVIGYDDSPMATRLWPPLTTVRLPIRDMGYMAADRLLHSSSSRTSTIVPSLVVRQSAAPARF